jgi:glucose/arabinose dehydrogenase
MIKWSMEMKKSATLAVGVEVICMLAVTSALGQLADPIPGAIPQSSIPLALRQVSDGLQSPNWATDAGDGSGRLFIVDQIGHVRIQHGGMLLSDPFLDVSPGNAAGNPNIVALNAAVDERGLLGLAFHPEFDTAGDPGVGKLYTYTSEPVGRAADFPLPVAGAVDHQSVIREWTVDGANPNQVDPGSMREIVRIDQPQANHNAGALAFGPDGMLYIALGDGGAADDQGSGHLPEGNGQSLDAILGKIVRIDVDGDDFPADVNRNYAVPADNPFVGEAGLDEIYAYGFRNPFRMSFDQDTGRLITGNVGQNDIEEVDIVTAGGNFGWRLKEGSFRFDPNGDNDGFVTDDLTGLPSDLTDPVIEYDHDEGVAVIGGFVYRGSILPELEGMYIFGELQGPSGAGRLFAGDLDSGEFTELMPGGQAFSGFVIKGFGQDENGELYVLASDGLGPFGQGIVLQIVPEPASIVLLATAAVGFGLLLLQHPTVRGSN